VLQAAALVITVGGQGAWFTGLRAVWIPLGARIGGQTKRGYQEQCSNCSGKMSHCILRSRNIMLNTSHNTITLRPPTHNTYIQPKRGNFYAGY
jgi:hypothetical protein